MAEPSVRRAEVAGAFARAADLGMGRPMGSGLRATLVAHRLAAQADCAPSECAEIYWLSLLHHVGCTADLRIAASVFGDEIAARRWTATVDTSQPGQVLRALGRNVAVGEPLPKRLFAWARTLSLLPRLMDTARSTCEVAAQLAGALGVPEPVHQALGAIFERWDGRGIPDGLSGARIPRAVRVAQIAYDLELFRSVQGDDAARGALAARRGKSLDPELAALALSGYDALVAAPPQGSAWDALIACEPDGPDVLDAAALDGALAAMGDMADLVSPIFAGHSRAVADRVGAALTRLGQPEADVRRGRLAAWAHDFGRIGIPVHAWEKTAPLDDDEREAIRLHAYQSGRLLDRIPGLVDVSRLAGGAHERADGSGYPGGVTAMSVVARTLAAADVLQALLETRPHRPARSLDQAAKVLDEEVQAGRLDRVAVNVLLDADGQPAARRAPWPDGLTEREVEVLGFVARGLTNKEIASALDLAPKTVGNHLQNLFPKIGVTTRAAASLYASRHQLLDFHGRS